MKMRSHFFVLFVAAVTVLSTNVRAQENAGATSQPGEAGETLGSPTQGDAPQTYSTEEVKKADGLATSSTSLETNVPQDAKRFNVDLYVRGEMNADQFSAKDPNYLNRNRVILKYKLDETKTISLTPEFRYYSKTSARPSSFQAFDTYLGYQDTKLIELPADITVTGIFRYYAPTGHQSQLSETLGSLFTWWFASKSIGKFDITFHADFNYYLNTKSDFNSPSTDVATGITSILRKGNPDYFIDDYLEVGYNFTPKFNLWADAGSYHETTLGTVGSPYTHGDYVYTALGASYSPTKQISLTAAMMNNAKFDRNNNFALYKAADNTALGIVTIGM